ncbi:MAG TPA: 16S rRNA (guanine(527)-N(7))-methyltransferase RsmG [Silvibacterium sp.]|nr:16S rRNA (guanine(527)-N(7))-methyltransferase RsmG [Silvibacterium sp.]
MSFSALNLALAKAGLTELAPHAGAQFETYLELLLKWNARLNLTAIREREAILGRHFVECIQCAQALPELPAGATLLDYGSGAGLPGIPIAICHPEIRVTLADSQGKKAAFLREVARSLGLNSEIFDGRIEEMSAERRFDVVTLRAVDRMAEACREALFRIVPGGWMVLLVTRAVAVRLPTAFPEVEWERSIAISGSETGEIVFGRARG